MKLINLCCNLKKTRENKIRNLPPVHLENRRRLRRQIQVRDRRSSQTHHTSYRDPFCILENDKTLKKIPKRFQNFKYEALESALFCLYLQIFCCLQFRDNRSTKSKAVYILFSVKYNDFYNFSNRVGINVQENLI